MQFCSNVPMIQDVFLAALAFPAFLACFTFTISTRIFDIFRELWDRYPIAVMQERPFFRFFLIYFPRSGGSLTRDGGSLSFL